ncbi:hypothetical protein Moror_4603 [Moniliophthora roreri MCA 2997]|uniref:Uncharacterized protein n=1 Tax=Moniliophthora roreri (strain MCA 2997) TaxID=1381753 RepID=V2WZN3_MONRO|nr:hypothetical protein Moror_4603 [Moniliophthora roreri MCA 2997]
MESFNSSPLPQQLEKKTAVMVKEWKRVFLLMEWGKEKMLDIELADLLLMIHKERMAKVTQIGGELVYCAKSPEEKKKFDCDVVDGLKLCLGSEGFDKLPADEHHDVELFLWCGCCMHKDLNSFRGGNMEMMAY